MIVRAACPSICKIKAFENETVIAYIETGSASGFRGLRELHRTLFCCVVRSRGLEPTGVTLIDEKKHASRCR